MLPNGLILVLDMALGPRATATEVGRARYASLVLGVLREDVVFVPGTAWTLPNPSLGHVWPRARGRCAKLFDRALAKAGAGESLASVAELGRAVHVLADMACPVHAQAVWHYLRDPFERCVDAAASDLRRLPVPELDSQLRVQGAEALVDSLAGAAQEEEADTTQTPWGRALRRAGWRRPPRGDVIRAQAERLIPLAAAHVRALLELFEAETELALTGPLARVITEA